MASQQVLLRELPTVPVYQNLLISQTKKIELPLDEAVKSWTKTNNNGILAIWFDNLESFKTYDMKNLRADNKSATPGTSPGLTKAMNF